MNTDMTQFTTIVVYGLGGVLGQEKYGKHLIKSLLSPLKRPMYVISNNGSRRGGQENHVEDFFGYIPCTNFFWTTYVLVTSCMLTIQPPDVRNFISILGFVHSQLALFINSCSMYV